MFQWKHERGWLSLANFSSTRRKFVVTITNTYKYVSIEFTDHSSQYHYLIRYMDIFTLIIFISMIWVRINTISWCYLKTHCFRLPDISLNYLYDLCVNFRFGNIDGIGLIAEANITNFMYLPDFLGLKHIFKKWEVF